MAYDILRARMQSWCIGLLSVVSDAYQLGAVIGYGAPIKLKKNNDFMRPDVIFVPAEFSKSINADFIAPGDIGPALAIDIISSATPETQHAARMKQYGDAKVLEVWQIEVDRPRVSFYQADTKWGYDLVPPDKGGIYYSSVAEELSFPVNWFRTQPNLWKMMEYWGMIDPQDE